MRVDGYQVTVPVSSEPLILSSDVKPWTRVDFSDDDALLTSLITRVRSLAESKTRRALATQTIQCYLRPDPVPAGILSGPVGAISDPLLYAERLSTSPFGTVPFIMTLPFPPVQSITSIDYQIWPFQSPEWTSLAQTDDQGNTIWRLNDLADPAEIYFAYPIVANRFRITMVCGYDPSAKPMPDDLKLILCQLIAYRYDNRSGEDWPKSLIDDLLSYRVERF